jgi:hypothetical protein
LKSIIQSYCDIRKFNRDVGSKSDPTYL